MRNNLISENVFDFSAEGSASSDLDNDVDPSNLVGERRIVYLVGASDHLVDSASDAGTVYCIDCFNITLSGLEIENGNSGVYLFNTVESAIRNCSISRNRVGIQLVNSNRNEIVENLADENVIGALISSSGYNRISGNEFLENQADGIMLIDSDGNVILENDVSKNGESGIFFDPFNENDVISNRLVENGAYRIKFDAGSDQNNLKGNGPDIPSAATGRGRIFQDAFCAIVFRRWRRLLSKSCRRGRRGGRVVPS